MNGRLKNWLQGGASFFLLDMALVAALALSLAYWTWAFVAPRSVAAPAMPAHGELDIARSAAAGQLFGARGTGAPLSAPTTKLRLLGVAAPGDRREGRAIFALENGKSRTARAGDALLPGLVLKEIHPDHAVLERDGRMERVGLERRAASVELAPRARRDGGR